MATTRKITPAKGHRPARDVKELQAALHPEEPVFPYSEGLREEFKSTWRKMVNTKTADYWNDGDIPLLEIYCRTVDDVRRLSVDILREGDVVRNARGNPVVNPKVVARNFAQQTLMTLANKLRMQPSSRTDPKQEGKQGARKKAAEDTAKRIGGGPALPDNVGYEDPNGDLLAGARQIQ